MIRFVVSRLLRWSDYHNVATIYNAIVFHVPKKWWY